MGPMGPPPMGGHGGPMGPHLGRKWPPTGPHGPLGPLWAGFLQALLLRVRRCLAGAFFFTQKTTFWDFQASQGLEFAIPSLPGAGICQALLLCVRRCLAGAFFFPRKPLFWIYRPLASHLQPLAGHLQATCAWIILDNLDYPRDGLLKGTLPYNTYNVTLEVALVQVVLGPCAQGPRTP